MRGIHKAFVDHEIMKAIDGQVAQEAGLNRAVVPNPDVVAEASSYLKNAMATYEPTIRQYPRLKQTDLSFYQDKIPEINQFIRNNMPRDDIYDNCYLYRDEATAVNQYHKAVQNYQMAARDSRTNPQQLQWAQQHLAIARSNLPDTVRRGLAASAQIYGIPVPNTGNATVDEITMISQLDTANAGDFPVCFRDPANPYVPHMITTVVNAYHHEVRQLAPYVHNIKNLPPRSPRAMPPTATTSSVAPPKPVHTPLTPAEKAAQQPMPKTPVHTNTHQQLPPLAKDTKSRVTYHDDGTSTRLQYGVLPDKEQQNMGDPVKEMLAARKPAIPATSQFDPANRPLPPPPPDNGELATKPDPTPSKASRHGYYRSDTQTGDVGLLRQRSARPAQACGSQHQSTSPVRPIRPVVR